MQRIRKKSLDEVRGSLGQREQSGAYDRKEHALLQKSKATPEREDRKKSHPIWASEIQAGFGVWGSRSSVGSIIDLKLRLESSDMPLF